MNKIEKEILAFIATYNGKVRVVDLDGEIESIVYKETYSNIFCKSHLRRAVSGLIEAGKINLSSDCLLSIPVKKKDVPMNFVRPWYNAKDDQPLNNDDVIVMFKSLIGSSPSLEGTRTGLGLQKTHFKKSWLGLPFQNSRLLLTPRLFRRSKTSCSIPSLSGYAH